jgi:hypothetical protein
MAALNSNLVIDDFHTTRTLGIAHHGDSFVVSVLIVIGLKTSGARARISSIPIVVDVIILDGNTWLDKVREDDATPGRVLNFKTIDRDVGIRGLTRRTRAYNSIGPSGTTIKDRKISAAIIAEGDRVALAPMDI